MRLRSRLLVLALLVAPAPARADEPDPANAILAGAGVHLAGFLVGGALLATARGDRDRENAGWLTTEGGFALAPLTAHAAVGEWGRGAMFAAVPTASFVSTAAFVAGQPNAVERGTLPQQRWMWAFFGVGMFASAVGVVDALFVGRRAKRVAVQPLLSSGLAGVSMGGEL